MPRFWCSHGRPLRSAAARRPNHGRCGLHSRWHRPAPARRARNHWRPAALPRVKATAVRAARRRAARSGQRQPVDRNCNTRRHGHLATVDARTADRDLGARCPATRADAGLGGQHIGAAGKAAVGLGHVDDVAGAGYTLQRLRACALASAAAETCTASSVDCGAAAAVEERPRETARNNCDGVGRYDERTYGNAKPRRWRAS